MLKLILILTIAVRLPIFTFMKLHIQITELGPRPIFTQETDDL